MRWLQEELIRAKSDVYNSTGSNNGYFKGRNVRESLNQLRVSLNRSLILPHIDNDSEEELNIDEHDVRELHLQLDNLHSSCEDQSKDSSDGRDSIHSCSLEEDCEMDLMSEPDVSFPVETEIGETKLEKPQKELPHKNIATTVDVPSRTMNSASGNSLSINSCRQSPFLQDPTLSESPRIGSSLRKSIMFSSNSFASQNNASNSSNLNSDVLHQSLKPSDQIRSSIRSSLQSSKVIPGPTESLAASLQRGLQIIDYHQRNSASNKSSVAFSFEHLMLKPSPEVEKVDTSFQKFPDEKPSLDVRSASFLCASSPRTGFDNSDEVQDSLKRWIVATDESGKSNGLV